jgi:hypothetical protein
MAEKILVVEPETSSWVEADRVISCCHDELPDLVS